MCREREGVLGHVVGICQRDHSLTLTIPALDYIHTPPERDTRMGSNRITVTKFLQFQTLSDNVIFLSQTHLAVNENEVSFTPKFCIFLGTKTNHVTFQKHTSHP